MKKTLKRAAMRPWLLVATAAMLLPAAVMAIVPLAHPPPSIVAVDINVGPGDQNNPQVSGDWVAYTSDLAIRHFNFSTNIDAEIPMGTSARDLLSDISGSKIVFSRVVVDDRTSVMVSTRPPPPRRSRSTRHSARCGSGRQLAAIPLRT